ncbi:hypothetical protein ACH3XW_4350 [Acanthocheilonema viteae]
MACVTASGLFCAGGCGCSVLLPRFSYFHFFTDAPVRSSQSTLRMLSLAKSIFGADEKYGYLQISFRKLNTLSTKNFRAIIPDVNHSQKSFPLSKISCFAGNKVAGERASFRKVRLWLVGQTTIVMSEFFLSDEF